MRPRVFGDFRARSKRASSPKCWKWASGNFSTIRAAQKSRPRFSNRNSTGRKLNDEYSNGMASDLGEFSPALIDAVSRLRAAFERAGIQYAIIGGIAVGSRSRPRATKDVDI